MIALGTGQPASPKIDGMPYVNIGSCDVVMRYEGQQFNVQFRLSRRKQM